MQAAGHKPGQVFDFEHGDEFVVPEYDDQVMRYEVSIAGRIGLVVTQGSNSDQIYIQEVDPKLTAWEAGIRPRMALLRIDGQEVVGDPKDLVHAAKARGQKSVMMDVLHPKDDQFYVDEEYEQTEEYTTDGEDEPLPPNYNNTEFLVNLVFEMFDLDNDALLNYEEFSEMQRAMNSPVADNEAFQQAFPGGFSKDDFRVDIARSQRRDLAHFKRILFDRQRQITPEAEIQHGPAARVPSNEAAARAPKFIRTQTQSTGNAGSAAPGAAFDVNPQPSYVPVETNETPLPGAGSGVPPKMPEFAKQASAAQYNSHYFNAGAWTGQHARPKGPLPTAWGHSTKKHTADPRASRMVFVNLGTSSNVELQAALVRCAKELEHRVADVRTSHEVILQGIDSVNQEAARVLGTDLDSIIQEPEHTTAAAVEWAHGKLAAVYIPPDAMGAYDAAEAARAPNGYGHQPGQSPRRPHRAGVDRIVAALTPPDERDDLHRIDPYSAQRNRHYSRRGQRSVSNSPHSVATSELSSIPTRPPTRNSQRQAHRPSASHSPFTSGAPRQPGYPSLYFPPDAAPQHHQHPQQHPHPSHYAHAQSRGRERPRAFMSSFTQ